MADRLIILDTETTGLDPLQGHRIIEIGCLELINRRLTGRKYQCYLHPEREIDPGASQISGLTLDFLKDKPKFIEIVDEFMNFIENSELVIHNAPFDLGFLNAELNRLNHARVPLEQHHSIIDTLQIARKLHPGQKNNLDALCKRYGIDNSHRNYHGALLDADILAKVYLQMTAGQSSLILDNEANVAQKNKQENRFTKIKRNKDGELVVIRADQKEIELHEHLMKKLNKNKPKIVETENA